MGTSPGATHRPVTTGGQATDRHPKLDTVQDSPGSGPSAIASTALLTDRYELTMVDAALRSGTSDRRCVFEVFARRLPDGRRYGVTAGTGRLLEALSRFTFDDAVLDTLERERVVSPSTLTWLSDYRFGGDIRGYGEGECYVPGSPLLVVEGGFAEAVLLETLVLSVLNHDSAIAAAASRMSTHATGRPCLEMGARRTHEEAAVAAARAAYLAGFTGTSNLEAGRRHRIPTIGTSAHAFTLLHDDERAAFTAQLAALGTGTTLLVDTYNVRDGVRHAIEVAGTGLGAVRIDSGDLLEQAHEVRAQLDALGATETKIVVTSDLDEYAIAALAAAPVDSYGVGTSLVTGSGAATAGLVYKLVARTDDDGILRPAAKRSQDKRGVGGRKDAFRRRNAEGTAVTEMIGVDGALDPGPEDRPLLRPLVHQGRIVGAEPLEDARARHVASLTELPATARQLSHGEPAIPTVFVTR
jgi:nicotinate phosphoribosyltransferase